MKKMYLLSTITALSLLTNCGAFKSREKLDAEVARVKKIAIVGMSVEEPVPSGISLSLGGSSNDKGGAMGMGEMYAKGAHADKMYKDLSTALAKKQKWRVTPINTLKRNASYKAAFKDTMKGWQNKVPPGEGRAQVVIEDIMDWDAIRILGQEGRDKLIEALKVNAIMAARVKVTLGGTKVMGIGARKPKSTLIFRMYKKGEAAPIWFEGAIEGKEMGSVGKTAMWSRSKMREYSVVSAKDAFSKIK